MLRRLPSGEVELHRGHEGRRNDQCDRHRMRTIGQGIPLCLSLLGSFVVVVVYFVISLLIAWQVAVSLVVFALVAALAMTRLYQKSFAVGGSLAPINAELQSALSEQFAGAKFIKASAGHDRAVALIEPVLRKLERANAAASSMPNTVRSVLEFIGLVGLAIILVLASEGMGVAAGNVVIVIALFGRLFPRIDRRAVANIFPQCQRTSDRGHQHITERGGSQSRTAAWPKPATDARASGGADRAEPSRQTWRARRS